MFFVLPGAVAPQQPQDRKRKRRTVPSTSRKKKVVSWDPKESVLEDEVEMEQFGQEKQGGSRRRVRKEVSVIYIVFKCSPYIYCLLKSSVKV